ncbi:MAG: T9SS type A sorting domain-containing protein [Flavobacteriaceae bacterium]
MKKKLLKTIWITGLIIFITGAAIAQPNIEWQKTYGGNENDFCWGIYPTTDGGYVLTGSTDSSANGDISGMNNGATDIWVVKIDDNGNIDWEKNFGGSNNDTAWSILQTTDGGYIVAGSSSSNDGDVSGNIGGNDFWILKLDANGIIDWEKSYGGSGTEQARSIQQTTDGGYIVAGTTSSNDGDVGGNNGGQDIWIVKLDTNGNIDWEKNYGGTSSDQARSIQQTTDGGYIVAGYTISNDGDVGGNYGESDIWIVKLFSNGNLDWEQNYGGSGDDKANSIQQTNDGGYIIAGESYSTNGDVGGNNGTRDYWILKINMTGTIEWDKNYGGFGHEYSYDIKQTSDNGYIVTGVSHSSGSGDVGGNNGGGDFWILKLDSNGNLDWEQNYGGNSHDNPYRIHQTQDGGYIIAGSTESTDLPGGNQGGLDFWLVKFEANNLSIDDVSSFKSLVIYPNPSKDIITLDHLTINSTIIIKDNLGKEIFRTITNSEKAIVSTSAFSNGVYVIQIKSNGNTINKKLIVNK